ncbi:MAG: type II toxin-antitoxin system RelE/ParE family toxin [Synergistaceae bacterium]|nr:type II toxin-antitoxin system RelE/ParE family toxin [Synergistaceae bacterium]MBQ6738641.1 type II toxin-antitoxin system RelE/ParE family toxin [Synergistaceae bacterium]MBQ7067991.1 type II toxin-antitoxin system RelE/ParE family toxin [Synergistaceae bacterium]MBR0074676.1 type II toxin-antitoxin system RelE/ParE family toxin [Synergistaceae bacterium]MBR0232552.1 type II toxin-antitoxin system RelE/ParE family toxin [Synergistaceae bacterium]
MQWQINFEEGARRSLEKLDKPIRQQIENYLDRLLTLENPRLRGKGLTASRSGQWRYRVGDYRIICEIKDNILVVLVLEIGHRSKIYE